jgi:hypothetical protein
MMSSDLSTWIAVLLTLAIFSFLYKDNPLFKLAEHIFAGVASAYIFCTQWHNVVKPNLIEPMVREQTPATERLLLIFPLFFCVCMLTKVSRKWGWISRWALAFIIGFYAGTNIPHYVQTSVIQQVESTWERPVIETDPEAGLQVEASIKNTIFLLGVISVLFFFYFSLPHTGRGGRILGRVSSLGRYFMMVAFGATFASAVMGRVSVLIGSLNLLLKDWLGLV